jgi:Uma2 family endonuclease
LYLEVVVTDESDGGCDLSAKSGQAQGTAKQTFVPMSLARRHHGLLDYVKFLLAGEPSTSESKGHQTPRRVDMTPATGAQDTKLYDNTQIVRLNVSWDAYDGLVAALGDDNHVRLAYDGETLEIMSPGYTHERIAKLVAAIVIYAFDAWGIDYEDAGSTTFRKKPVGGFEGDASFYTVNADRIRGLRDIDLSIHPAPDLMLEVDISNRRMDKKELYEGCGVSEFWRFDESDGIEVFALEDGAYVEIDTSRIIRGLPISVVNGFVDRMKQGDKRPAIVVSVQKWLRDNQYLHDAKSAKPEPL